MFQPFLDPTSPQAIWCEKTQTRTADVAGIIHSHLGDLSFVTIKSILAVDPKTILPFESAVLPADKNVLSRIFEGYQEVTGDEFNALNAYSKAKENYGTAPGEAAALIVGLIRSLKPETAFVFGTARGRIEQLIAQNTKAEIVTIDLPTEIVQTAAGRPDSNNLRYRINIGIDSDEKIGDIFRSDPAISGRVHQILGDSFLFEANQLAKTMRLVVVDGNHKLANSLMDMANALEMIHDNGGVIVIDDFRKISPLNAGVEAAALIFNQITGLSILQPCPKPNEEGLNAAVAVIVVPEKFKSSGSLQELRALARMFSSRVEEC